MTREELKQLWFSIPTDKNKVETKTILVETKYGHVEIVSDGPNGYSSFKTNQGDNALQYALDRIKESKGCKYRDLSEYTLVIK